jgi:hypothetical protein
MKARFGFSAVIVWSTTIGLTALTAGCSGELMGMDSCNNAKDVKLLIKLDAGNPKAVKHDSLFAGDAEFAVVCPNKKLIWKLAGSKSFTIRFKDESPFPWTDKVSTGGTVEDVVPVAAVYGGYPYTVEVEGSSKPLDPIIIVDK